MRKLSQAEWIGVVTGIIIVVGAFYYVPALRFFTEENGPVLTEASEADSVASVNFEDTLMIEDKTIGSGETVQVGDIVAVHYTGRLEDGTVFDSSQGRSPLQFTLGAGQVIQGWDQGLIGMRIGGKRTLTIPPELAYGKSGYGPIPPNATLVFDVALVDILK